MEQKSLRLSANAVVERLIPPVAQRASAVSSPQSNGEMMMHSRYGTFCQHVLLLALVLQPADLGAQPADSRGVTVLSVPQKVRVEEGFEASQAAGLFVGVRDFDDEDFAEVPFAVDDAVDLAYLFAIDLKLISPRRIVLCLSGQPSKPESQERLKTLRQAGAKRRPATRSEVFERLTDLGRRKSGDQGLLVVALATHGFSAGGEDFLVAEDSLRHRIHSSGIAVGKVFAEVSAAKAPRRLLLLDACRENLSLTRGGADPQGAMGQKLADAIAAARGLVVLSATTLGGYSYDDRDRRNGVFTRALIDGLHGQAPADDRSFITVRLLADFVHQRVVDWVGLNRPDHVEISRGISVRLEVPAIAEMPLAVVSPGTVQRRARPDGAPPPGEVDFAGDWQGVYHLYPETYEMNLSVSSSYVNAGDRFTVRMGVRPLVMPKRRGRPRIMGELESEISYNPRDRSLVIRPPRTFERSQRLSRLMTMHAVYSRADDTIAGIFQGWPGDSSPFFVLRRVAKSDQLTAAARESMADKSARWARGGPSKERVDEWADRYVEEYPGRAPNGIEYGRLFSRARKLFKDSHFVAYFGKPFEHLETAERAAVGKKLEKRNPVDGVARNSFAECAFTSSGTFGVADVTVSVLAMRAIESWFTEMKRQLDYLPADPGSRPMIDAFEARVRAMPEVFWPSEIAAISSRADEIRSEIE